MWQIDILESFGLFCGHLEFMGHSEKPLLFRGQKPGKKRIKRISMLVFINKCWCVCQIEDFLSLKMGPGLYTI